MSVSGHRVTLLFNPVAGKHPQRRLEIVERLAREAERAGATVELVATKAPGSGGKQAAAACTQGADIVFACGGDGTVHDVLQGMVFQPRCALGVVPLGSANVLARHLRLPMNPELALLKQLTREASLVPVGKVSYTTPQGEASRFFTVVAGAGPDGALVYRALAASKQRLGRWSYYVRALSLLLRSRFATFDLSYETAVDTVESMPAISAMSVRVNDIGGMFRPLFRGASQEDRDLLLVAAAPPALLSLPMWFGAHSIGKHPNRRFVRVTRTAGFRCSGGADGTPVQVEADGEWLGRTPMSVSVVPHALRLLMPHTAT